MVINYSEKKKKQQYLVLVFLMLFLATFLVVWFGVLKKPKSLLLPAVSEPIKKIEINFEALRHPFLEKAQPFEEIKPIEKTQLPEEKIGRENPFSRYSKTEF